MASVIELFDNEKEWRMNFNPVCPRHTTPQKLPGISNFLHSLNSEYPGGGTKSRLPRQLTQWADLQLQSKYISHVILVNVSLFSQWTDIYPPGYNHKCLFSFHPPTHRAPMNRLQGMPRCLAGVKWHHSKWL